MKTNIFRTLVLCLFLSLNHANPLSAAASFFGQDPDIKVVVSQKRIWLVTDEISVKSLTVQVMNAKGKVVMEKNFSSKMTDWSLQIASLPEGTYSVMVGSKKMTEFTR